MDKEVGKKRVRERKETKIMTKGVCAFSQESS
jgi:hypothetical protein